MSIVIKWDRAPVRQSFGACNVVFDGVATVNGKSYRINGSANRACRKIEIALRYLTHAKRGDTVPVSMLHDVRVAAMQSAAELLAPMRAEYVAKAQAADEAYMAEQGKDMGFPVETISRAVPVSLAITSAPMEACPVCSGTGQGEATRNGRPDMGGCDTCDASGIVAAPVVDPRARVAANIAALSAPVMVANTSRACYWRLSGGYVATGPDVTPVDNGQGWKRLDSLMAAKGEGLETIHRLSDKYGKERA